MINTTGLFQVKPSFDLPEGYTLREDSEFLYLIHESKRIAAFTHYTTPYYINQTIKDYEEMKGA